MTSRAIATAAALSLLLILTGCSSPASPTDDTAPAGASDQTDAGEEPTGDALDGITSCDAVESAVSPYIQGLVAAEDNVVDEWGVSCQWEMPEDNTDWANNRSVSVGISPEPPEKPDLAQLTAMAENIVGVDDSWVTEMGGVAYAMTMDTAVAAATVTTVWLPDAEIIITGGTWGDYPSLDGPAAVQVAQTLLD